MLKFTFEHKHTKTLRTGYGINVWEAYKEAEILTASAREIWKPIDIVEFEL